VKGDGETGKMKERVKKKKGSGGENYRDPERKKHKKSLRPFCMKKMFCRGYWRILAQERRGDK